MENIRFLLYAAFWGFVFLIMTAIKNLSPEKKAPVDEIGMKLYRPIFFGTKDKPRKKATIKKPVKENPLPEKIKEKPVTVTTKKTNTASSSDEDYFSKMIQDYKTNVLTKRKYRNDVVVRYYRHESDGDKAQLLVDYGFYLHERPLGRNRYENLSSNIIYFGQEFPERDLKLIAYLLVKNGIPIKELRPFKDYDGWKKKAIEIGGSSKLADSPVLSFEDIRSFGAKQ